MITNYYYNHYHHHHHRRRRLPKQTGFYMMSSFPPGQSKQTATLRSADVPSSSEEQCLEINYFTNYRTFTLVVSSTNPLDAPPVSKKLETDGEFQVYYPLKPSVGKRSIVIVATFVSGSTKDDASEREVRVRRIEVLKGSCPTTGFLICRWLFVSYKMLWNLCRENNKQYLINFQPYLILLKIKV